jgi:hypothetical protein
MLIPIATAIASIAAAILYTNIFEWLAHKYLLHGLGKRRESFWSFHWHEHHRESRRGNMFDAQYERSLFTWSPQAKEALSVAGAIVLHGALFPIAPWFAAFCVLHGVRYYFFHRRAHVDREWCKRRAPWHYDHHMGKDQNANWCVMHPWFDHVMGTRKKYVYDAAGKPLAEELVPRPAGFVPRFVTPLLEGHHERVAMREDSPARLADAA